MKTKLHFIENETNVELLEMFSQRNRSVCTIAVKQQSLNFCIFFVHPISSRLFFNSWTGLHLGAALVWFKMTYSVTTVNGII